MASSVFTVMGRSRSRSQRSGSRSPRSDSRSARRLRSRSPDKDPGAESEQPGTGKESPTQHPSDGADGVTLAGIEFRAIIASAINDLLDAHALGLSSEPSSEQ